jgi:hypothetical protein
MSKANLPSSVTIATGVPGAPTAGTWATHQSIIDSNGIAWTCSAGGTPGTWAEGASGAAISDTTLWLPSTAYNVGQIYTSPKGDRREVITGYSSGTAYGTADTIATVTLGNAAGLTAGPAYNMAPQNLSKFRRALARVRSGTGFGDLFCVGDSTTEGNYATAFDTNYPSILTKLLNGYVIPTAQTWAFPHNDAATGATDPRVTFGSNWSTHNGTYFQDWTNISGTSDTLTYAPCGTNEGPASVDTFVIYYIQNTGGYGTFALNIDGGSTLSTVNCSGALQVKSVTVTAGSAGTHVLNIVGPSSSGYLAILGINAYSSTSPILRVANVGIGASQSVFWASQTNPYNYGLWATNFTPDLSIIDLGINDSWNSVAAATYKTNMQTVITEGLVSGDVILKTMVPSGGGGGYPQAPVFEPLYQPQIWSLAQTNSLGLIDVYSRWTSYTVSNALGYFAASGSQLHPNSLGYADVAEAVFAAIRTP